MRAFLCGMARILDLFGIFPRTPIEKNDAMAIYRDWERVGKDLETVIRKWEKENEISRN